MIRQTYFYLGGEGGSFIRIVLALIISVTGQGPIHFVLCLGVADPFTYIYLIQLCMQKSDSEHTRPKVPDTSTVKLGQHFLYSPLTCTVVMISELSVEMFCAILVEFYRKR